MLTSSYKSSAVARGIKRNLFHECDLVGRVPDGEGGFTWEVEEDGVDCYGWRRTAGSADIVERANQRRDEPEWGFFFNTDAPINEGQRILFSEGGHEHTLTVDAIRPGTNGAFFLVIATEVHPDGGQ